MTAFLSGRVKEAERVIPLSTINPDVEGYAVDCGPRGIYVPFVYSRREGEGNVGWLIEWLQEQYSVVKFPNVLNPKLVGMLLRRGFKPEMEYAEAFGEAVEVWTWRRE